MNQQDREQAENLRELLRQHWLHARHIESERAWFMSVYAAITGGILAYLSTAGSSELWPLYFLMVFTLIGFLLNCRWKHAFEHHQKCIKDTASRLGITADIDIPANHIWKVIKTRYLFLSFYAIVFVGLIIVVII